MGASASHNLSLPLGLQPSTDLQSPEQGSCEFSGWKVALISTQALLPACSALGKEGIEESFTFISLALPPA